jgi:hypothetical protein
MGANISQNKPNVLQTDYNQSKLVLGGNRFETVSFTASGAAVVLTRGMVIGKISATQKGKALASAATDGSQFPFGIVPENITIADGETQDVSVVVSGDVAAQLVTLDGGDSMATVVDGKSIGDRVAGDTLGIKLVETDELSQADNS